MFYSWTPFLTVQKGTVLLLVGEKLTLAIYRQTNRRILSILLWDVEERAKLHLFPAIFQLMIAMPFTFSGRKESDEENQWWITHFVEFGPYSHQFTLTSLRWRASLWRLNFMRINIISYETSFQRLLRIPNTHRCIRYFLLSVVKI